MASCSTERVLAPSSSRLTNRPKMTDVIDTIISLSGFSNEALSSVDCTLSCSVSGNESLSAFSMRCAKHSMFRWVPWSSCVTFDVSSFTFKHCVIALSMTIAMISNTLVVWSSESRISGGHSSQIKGRLTMVTIGNILSVKIDGDLLAISNVVGQKYAVRRVWNSSDITLLTSMPSLSFFVVMRRTRMTTFTRSSTPFTKKSIFASSGRVILWSWMGGNTEPWDWSSLSSAKLICSESKEHDATDRSSATTSTSSPVFVSLQPLAVPIWMLLTIALMNNCSIKIALSFTVDFKILWLVASRMIIPSKHNSPIGPVLSLILMIFGTYKGLKNK